MLSIARPGLLHLGGCGGVHDDRRVVAGVEPSFRALRLAYIAPQKQALGTGWLGSRIRCQARGAITRHALLGLEYWSSLLLSRGEAFGSQRDRHARASELFDEREDDKEDISPFAAEQGVRW